MSSKNCGFPIDWFVEQPKDFLICSICLEVLNDPHCCRNGHNFCKSCISEALEIKQECPECKISLKNSLLTKNLAVRNMVLDSSVPCPHLSKTVLCGWVGSLSKRSAHEANCPEIIVACPLREWKLCTSECTGMLRRGDLQNHISKSVESELKLICDLSARLKTNTYKLKQFEIVAEQTVGYVARAEADGTIYCGQISNAGEKHGYGTIYRNHERTGQGNFVNGKLSGNNCYLMGDDGSKYTGQIQSGLYHGFGKIFYCDKSSYEGQWKDGKWHDGKGHWKRPNGFEYVGCFVNKMVHGKGKMTCADKSVYEGDFSMGQKHGNGHLKTAKGRIFVNGKTNGHGTLHAPNGSLLYQGEFKDGLKHGSGVGAAMWLGMSTYKYNGQWERGFIHGQGVLTGPGDDKFRYSGSFVNGNRYGLGKQTSSSGDIYVGSWKNDERHGKGTETYLNGDRYSGDFVADVKEGNGACTYADGNKYMGQWEKDKMHGHGVFTVKNGETFEGEFIEGRRISGKLTGVDGTICEGKVVTDDKFQNPVKITYVNGDVYTGEVTNNSKRSGQGKLTAASGLVIFDGQWYNDAYQTGTLMLTDGTVCTGEFHNWDVAGGSGFLKGRKTWANGDTFEFEGSWDKRGLIFGKGTSTVLSADGQKTECYAGTFVDGKKHGKGKLTLANGDIYTGEFKDDKMHGKGQLKRKGVRKLVKGEWVEGVLEQQQA